MRPQDLRRRPLNARVAASPPLHRAALGGAVGAVASLAIVITLGVVALAPLHAPAAGVVAAFLGVIVSAGVYGLTGRSPLPIGGPSSATAVITAALVARLAQSPALPADAGSAAAIAAVLVALGCAVVVMGLAQVAMALAGMGRLARFVPQPVLAGFMNGVALLIVASQLPALLALEPGRWAADGLVAAQDVQPGALLLGLATALGVAVLLRSRPRWPAALIGLLAAVAVWQAAAHALPGPWLGATLDRVAMPSRLTGPAGAFDAPAALALVLVHPFSVLLSGLVLALVGGLESMLNLRAIDQQLGHRTDENHELLTVGLGNIAGGLVGALPMVLLRARAASILQGGGIGRAAAVAAVAVSLLLLVAGGSLLALLPKAALAGVMLVVAASLVDGWSRSMLRQCRDPRRRATLLLPLLTMALVAMVTVLLGPGAGVAAGIAVSAAVFVRLVRGQTLRWRGTAEARPSRRVYPAPLEMTLSVLRRQVLVLELQGALFWGNAERVSDEAETLPGDCRFVVLDLRRVSAVDESAAVELLRLDRRLAAVGVTLLPAGPASAVTAGRPWGDFLADAAGTLPIGCWPDADRAVEHAERVLLAEQGATPDLLVQPVAPEDTLLLRGLGPKQQRTVLGLLRLRTLAAGDALFREGDAADAVYLLTRGSITVSARGGTRFVSFSPGTLLGELAVLDGRGRSADAVADRASEVHALSRAALEGLAIEDPTLAALLYRQIAVHLADRLRVASAAWRDAAS